MSLYRQAITTPLLPWRLRHGLQHWVETIAATHLPWLYRGLHFGRLADPVRAVSQGPHHHFYGYYDKSPWNASGRYLLAHEAAFNDRPPTADDPISVGLIDLKGDNRYARLAAGFAWNWQQGAMLQWHPRDPEMLFVYNDRRDGRLVGVVRHIERGEQAVYERPLYALLPDGRSGFSINFARLAQHRPGYGYAGVPDPCQAQPHPDQDGLWHVNLDNGRTELILSLAQLAAYRPKPSMAGAWHYLNHVQASRGGARIAFFHIWHTDPSRWEVRLFTCRPDGSELNCLLDTGFISHYDWRDDDSILVWANRRSGPACFQLLSHTSANSPRIFGEGVLTEDGHCSFSPDGRWVLNDTYPDQYDKRTLMLVRYADAKRIDLARLHSPKARWWGEIRCDLHPRWSRDGRRICLDSVHEGTRQMYLVEVGEFVQ